jgi:pyridoxal phosphate enzyme (YggS family)
MAKLRIDQAADSVEGRIAQVWARIRAAALRAGREPQTITLIAVTKTVPVERIAAALVAGMRDLGENRVQEAALKRPALAQYPGARWHLIGRLQRNKVARAAEIFDVVHSVDSLELAGRIARYWGEGGRVVEAFVEVNVSGEPTKAGFTPAEMRVQAEQLASLSQIRWRGLMTIAPQGADPAALRSVFQATRKLHCAVAPMFDPLTWNALSMGMSDDFELAIEEGATHVRVGRAIFGEREQAQQG